ncbi:nuclear pore complex protein NUP133 isoform X2 [Selaginella moellendorffii]|uniref:nuclear pore complex protein NUP133 isoform X2 n=1 Tax=Selaginella moellendorffii TaxID=88036 RepID=UPI000D1CE745|nr:nuclear pore complex protein NUP133 isoform X2 [Selaginella moellendorffii]|eukprot:XP_024526327.1 nuclear pore complex protein NUP133 isoform X2 [Selaginella moellendorffii]
MFSPASRGARARKAPQRHGADSPAPALGSAATASSSPQAPPMPTPSPASKHFRMAPILKSGDKKSIADGCDPVFVCDFPHQLRAAVTEAAPSHRSEARGGMDGGSGLSWMLHRTKIFVWSHLRNQASSECKILNVPPQLCTEGDGQSIDSRHGSSWLVRIVNRGKESSLVKGRVSASLVLCSQKSLTVVYWPDIFRDTEILPVVAMPDDKLLQIDDRYGGAPGRRSSSSSYGPQADTKPVKSLIATGLRNLECVAIASCLGNLWRFDCSVSGISWRSVNAEVRGKSDNFGPFDFNNNGIVRSLVWWSREELLLLTPRGIECWDVQLVKGGQLSKAWAYDISEDAEVLKDLTSQKQVWLLDLQVTAEKNLTVLAASLSKDRVTSSSYMQYFMLTFLCAPPSGRRFGECCDPQFRCVKKKAPAQVILPKARVEVEEFLYSMQLRVGGKPAGSAMVLAGDGTATISHYLHGVGRLYQFDLAWDAGRVLDASVVPSVDDSDEGAWLVLTEKAGVWGIPERAVLLGAVEPPERSLSRKGSAKDESVKEQRRRLAVESTDGVGKVLTRNSTQRLLQDEEAEATVGQLFQHYVTTRQVIAVFEKLQKTGAFDDEGEMNIFARFSKSIVDTIAKHWASGGAGGAATMAITSQLTEKQKRHQQYLNFLAASKCHEFLRHQRRSSLHTILEHGEKLAALLKIKDTYNSRAPGQSGGEAEEAQITGALWDTIQLVGEKARRKNVMLMDKEKMEVFFTRVSDIEELFGCIDEHSQAIIGQEMSLKSQTERLCEVADACSSAVRAGIQYRDTQQTWYPSPEGLTPWYCKATVRSGLWRLATHLMDVQTELDVQSKEKLMVSLADIADVLLEGYAGAILAKIERDEEYRGLQLEYWSRRDSLLLTLQQHEREAAELASQHAESADAGEQKRLEVLRDRYSSLLALARRHAGYQTLWEICIDLNDMDCLRKLMHESMGLKEGRFSNYVFEQFLKKGQYSKLLRLGEEFAEDLASFLRDKKSLSWLHDFFLKRFTAASDTTHHLALSSSDLNIPIIRDEKPTSGFTLSARRKLLYLAKLSALAGWKRGAVDKSIQIEADLGILAVQAAAELGIATSTEVLSPLQLVEACLNSGHKELVIRSLEVFALSGDFFRRGNKSLLEATWLKLADQDDWLKMRQLSDEECWNDQQQYEALKATALYAASKYCYGGSAFVVGTLFEETLPLFREIDASSRRAEPGSAGSVNEVLTEHEDFPEAGEAMVMALRMGKGLELVAEEDNCMEM